MGQCCSNQISQQNEKNLLESAPLNMTPREAVNSHRGPPSLARSANLNNDNLSQSESNFK